MELTIESACKHPANFMYIWASDAFLAKIDSKHRSIIRLKRMNQNKLLALSAEKYGKTVKDYTEAIRAAFINAYGMTPASALDVLAAGGTVAGKNWAEGVYGIGATTNTFPGGVDGQPVTVDATTGHIFLGTRDMTDESKTVYGQVNKETKATQLFSVPTGDDGVVYCSQYKKLGKKYVAYSYTGSDGVVHSPNGGEISASNSADIWGSIMESIQVFLTWIMSLFGGGTQRETLSAANTLPSQKSDGFVTEQAGMSTAGIIALLCVGGGALLYGGLGKKKKHAQA